MLDSEKRDLEAYKRSHCVTLWIADINSLTTHKNRPGVLPTWVNNPDQFRKYFAELEDVKKDTGILEFVERIDYEDKQKTDIITLWSLKPGEISWQIK